MDVKENLFGYIHLGIEFVWMAYY